MKVDKKTLSSMRREFYLRNALWCPDEKIRINMFVEEHFIERLFERFEKVAAANLIKRIWAWIDESYCLLLYDAHSNESATKYRIPFEEGTVCFSLFANTLRIRTCFVEGEEDM